MQEGELEIFKGIVISILEAANMAYKVRWIEYSTPDPMSPNGNMSMVAKLHYKDDSIMISLMREEKTLCVEWWNKFSLYDESLLDKASAALMVRMAFTDRNYIGHDPSNYDQGEFEDLGLSRLYTAEKSPVIRKLICDEHTLNSYGYREHCYWCPECWM